MQEQVRGRIQQKVTQMQDSTVRCVVFTHLLVEADARHAANIVLLEIVNAPLRSVDSVNHEEVESSARGCDGTVVLVIDRTKASEAPVPDDGNATAK
jgi:hypothetical protein